jgi:hypothetical protein
VKRVYFYREDYSRFIQRWPRLARYVQSIPGAAAVRGIISFTPYKTITLEWCFYLGDKVPYHGLRNTNRFTRFFLTKTTMGGEIEWRRNKEWRFCLPTRGAIRERNSGAHPGLENRACPNQILRIQRK